MTVTNSLILLSRWSKNLTWRTIYVKRVILMQIGTCERFGLQRLVVPIYSISHKKEVLYRQRTGSRLTRQTDMWCWMEFIVWRSSLATSNTNVIVDMRQCPSDTEDVTEWDSLRQTSYCLRVNARPARGVICLCVHWILFIFWWIIYRCLSLSGGRLVMSVISLKSSDVLIDSRRALCGPFWAIRAHVGACMCGSVVYIYIYIYVYSGVEAK